MAQDSYRFAFATQPCLQAFKLSHREAFHERASLVTISASLLQAFPKQPTKKTFVACSYVTCYSTTEKQAGKTQFG